MKPYNKDFIVKEVQEYNSLINECTLDCYSIKKKSSKGIKLQGYMYENTEEYDLPIIQLLKDDKSLMRITPKEIESSYQAIKFAKGKVGIVGLGLGYVVDKIAKKTKVNQVIVYEISEEVIEMYKKNFGENKKVKIIHGDAFKAKPEKFDFFYVDIYEYKLELKVVEDYNTFNKLHEIEEYSFWGMEHFLLSCNYEEVLWVYIPENWIEMSKNLYVSLDTSGYIKNYKQLEEDKVRDVLKEFKKILNNDIEI
ncbi:methyltransferase domain-containing protein [Clostridium sp. ZBS15]|uniref:methyltransferase domain-containing protein n=1 Tax=Clostridium sp. ZBS15 TaxID=2949969 RepID=UPI0020793D15|nr:methyltransferase domain-containing protein [Clostridium sp. ZBS15]